MIQKLKKMGRNLLVRIGKFFLFLMIKTCRVKIIELERYEQMLQKGPFVLMLWHNRLLPFPCFIDKVSVPAKYVPVISNSRDGGLIEELVRHVPNLRLIRVHHRDQAKALDEMIKAIENKEVIVITPDGPRGPKYFCKRGAAVTVSQTGCAAMGVSWSGNYWELNTWDGFRIPKPFSEIEVKFSPAVQLKGDDVEENRRILEDLLRDLD